MGIAYKFLYKLSLYNIIYSEIPVVIVRHPKPCRMWNTGASSCPEPNKSLVVGACCTPNFEVVACHQDRYRQQSRLASDDSGPYPVYVSHIGDIAINQLMGSHTLPDPFPFEGSKS